MVIAVYLITFILSILAMAYYFIRNEKVDTVFVLFGIGVVCVCGGRFFITVSGALETAIVFNKVMYLGACFCPLFAVFICMELCQIHMPKWLSGILIAYTVAVYGMVLTIGYSGFYYWDVRLIQDPKYHFLLKNYGPGHIFYQIMLGIDFVLIICVLIYAIRHRSRISSRTVIAVGSFVAGITIIYALERMFNSTVSYLTVGYLLLSISMVYISERINMYDMSKNITYSVERMKSYGYIEFDRKYRYIGSNRYVKDIFPEIAEWKVDAPVKESDSFLYREIYQWVVNHSENDRDVVEYNGTYLEITERNLVYGAHKKVGYLLEMIDRTAENKYLNAVEHYNDDLEEEVAEQTANISHIKDMMVLGMATMVESRDNSTGGHIRRTSLCMKVFAPNLLKEKEKLGIDSRFVDMIVRAAPMHDLGKISVDDKVLRKNGKYTDEEYNQMKKHSLAGKNILEQILRGVEDDTFVDICENVAHYHHEKWNGKGYPEGISGEQIPVEARIMALVDVFDALVSKRCYKEAFSYDKAFQIIEESLGSHFDPFIGRMFLDCRPQLEELYNGFED